jgi:two-component system NarL family sensor kinase
VSGKRCVLVCALDFSEVHILKRERRRLGNQVLHAQERERRRIARELHDSTSQLLVGLSLDLLNLTHAGGTPKADALIEDCKKTIFEMQREIRSFSFIAHPPTLSANGLGQALEVLTNGFAARTGLPIDLQLSDVGRASEAVEASLYRLAQEALANIHRHASAGSASVRLVGTKRCLHLRICDDGIGFDAADLPLQKHLGVGVTGMAERVSELGGRFSIHRIGHGTAVSVAIPRGSANEVC